MGREIRRVSATWEHPRENGDYSPLHGGSYQEAITDWLEGQAHWHAGEVKDWSGEDSWRPKDGSEGELFEDWCGDIPVRHLYMPEWPEDERTHYQMYETCSEGTPVSPVLPTPEAVARWCADNGASAFGDQTASYDAWLRVARGGYACSGVVGPETGGKLVSGVEGIRQRGVD